MSSLACWLLLLPRAGSLAPAVFERWMEQVCHPFRDGSLTVKASMIKTANFAPWLRASPGGCYIIFTAWLPPPPPRLVQNAEYALSGLDNVLCAVLKKYLCLRVHLPHSSHVEVRRQLMRIGSLLPPCEPLGSNSSPRAWYLMPFPTELSSQPLKFC